MTPIGKKCGMWREKMTKWVTIKKNGKKRAVPLGSPRKGFIKPVSQKELG